ncbi:MAG TPA: redoxin domain-containing protein [Luteibaculaceae bacterium]|nr:redoxin domain-containing protein [Luteibaculaceae bacterium]
MFKNICLVLGFIASTLASVGQIKDYQYKFTVKGAKERDTIYLANYFGKQLYYNDTAYADKTGTFTFKKKRNIDPGQFAVVMPGSKYFEILINEPAFYLKTDTADFVKNMVCEGSVENKIFYDYIDFLSKKRESMNPLNEAYDKAKDEKEKEEIQKKRIAVDAEVKAYQKQLAENHKNLLVGQMVALSLDIDIPEAPKKADGTMDSAWAYYYARDHYFDLANLKNDALARTPSFHSKLDYFISKMVLQNPDTICKVTKTLTDKMNPTGDLFKYTVTHVTETYNKSNIMGMDAVFVCMADQYYLAGKAYWSDSSRVNKIRERADALRPILLGKATHPLSLADTTHQNWKRLYDLKADYTVLVFWDPDCGHCKKEMPKLAELYSKTNGKDFQVYAVSSDATDKWKKFIKDNNMTFVNVAVPDAVRNDQDKLVKLISAGTTDLKSLNYHETFDVYSTPKVFVLDKDKKIVAKQIGIEQLEEILGQIKELDQKRTAVK